MASTEPSPPSWVRRWEDLPTGAQLGITLPIAIVALFVIHVTLLNQPLLRGFGYGVFWGLLLTGAIMVATRTERAKRRGAKRSR